MDSIQPLIIAGVILLIVITIGYYWYQEYKFKRMVEKSFNQKTEDVIKGNKAVVMEGSHLDEKDSHPPIMSKDIAFDLENQEHLDELNDHKDNETNLEAELPFNEMVKVDEVIDSQALEIETPEIEIPEDSAEAFFVKVDAVEFPFAKSIDTDCDLVVDIVFEEIKKIKVLPEITQFTNKPFVFYVLDKDNHWQDFERGHKYAVKALKLILPLVDKDGVISQAQVANIYNELHKFVIQNDAHIRHSDYETSINNIQNQMRYFNELELDLELYLILKEKTSYANIARFFNGLGLVETNGKFICNENGATLFSISDGNEQNLQHGFEFQLLSLSSSLHFQPDPKSAIERILDYSERFMRQFESRLLTANKQIFEQKDYDSLSRYVSTYVQEAEKHGIKLGSKLIFRILG